MLAELDQKDENRIKKANIAIEHSEKNITNENKFKSYGKMAWHGMQDSVGVAGRNIAKIAVTTVGGTVRTLGKGAYVFAYGGKLAVEGFFNVVKATGGAIFSCLPSDD